MIYWVETKTVLYGDPAKCGKRRADTLDRGCEDVALIVQECGTPFEALNYCKRANEIEAAKMPQKEVMA